MKAQAENVYVILEIKLKAIDRLVLLFGGTLKMRTSTPVTYDMKRGMRVGKTDVQYGASFGPRVKNEVSEAVLAHES